MQKMKKGMLLGIPWQAQTDKSLITNQQRE